MIRDAGLFGERHSMRRVFAQFVVYVFLWSSVSAWGKQGTPSPVTADSERPANQNDSRTPAQGCSSLFDAFRLAKQDAERAQRESEFNQCMALNNRPGALPE